MLTANRCMQSTSSRRSYSELPPSFGRGIAKPTGQGIVFGRMQRFEWPVQRDALNAALPPSIGPNPYTKKPRSLSTTGSLKKNLAAPYFHAALRRTILGMEAFNFRVRNGNGWFHLRKPPGKFSVSGLV